MKFTKNKSKKQESSDSDDNDHDDMPGAALPDLQSPRDGLQSVVNAMLRQPERGVSSMSPESRQSRSSARMSAHLSTQVTPKRTTEGAVQNFSWPLSRTPTKTPESGGIITAGPSTTPTSSPSTIVGRAMTSDDVFSGGDLGAPSWSKAVNRRLNFTDAITEEPVPPLPQHFDAEGKRKMPGYVPTVTMFTKEFWPSFDSNTQHLHLDLFWPGVGSEPRDGDTFPLEDLEPLCNFHQLRSLKITGMLDSYQKYIWQAVWLNPNLKELTLEMALEPSIRRNHDKDWPTIQGSWQLKKLSDVKGSYHGDKGQGIVHHNIGYGEYLDTFSIMNAKKEAQAKGPVTEKLPIAILRLTGFVVDADPFKRWFDPDKLRQIHFVNDCVDAGFALSLEMLQKVKITCPGDGAPRVIQAQAVKLSDLKLITLSKGKKVAEEPAFPHLLAAERKGQKTKRALQAGEGSKDAGSKGQGDKTQGGKAEGSKGEGSEGAGSKGEGGEGEGGIRKGGKRKRSKGKGSKGEGSISNLSIGDLSIQDLSKGEGSKGGQGEGDQGEGDQGKGEGVEGEGSQG